MELVPLTATDGATSQSRLFFAGAEAPAVVVSPAMGVSAKVYDRLGEALVAQGITALVGEHRGGDSSSVRAKRGVDYGYAELLGDLELQFAQLRARATGPLHLIGHSLGGHLGVVGLARWWQPGAKLVLIASGTVHFRAWAGAQQPSLYFRTQAAQVISRALGYFPGDRLKFGGVQGQSLIREWAGAARHGEYRSLRTGTLEHRLDALAPEVLAIQVKGDTLAPPSSFEGLLSKLKRATIERVELEPPAEPKKMDAHFRWMREPAGAARLIAGFVKRNEPHDSKAPDRRSH